MPFQCDLAARNVLVTQDLNLKITDFGLSERDYQFISGSTAVKGPDTARQPIAWLAYEILKNKEKIYASDVWAFGVYMWEVFQFGSGHPYRHLWERGAIEFFQLVKYLEDGNRLAMPEFCPDEVFEVMKKCWNLDPDQRPSFEELKDTLEKLASKIHRHEIYLDVESRRESESSSVRYSTAIISTPISPVTVETRAPYVEVEEDDINQFKFPSVQSNLEHLEVIEEMSETSTIKKTV